jgi:hypothetical protein
MKVDKMLTIECGGKLCPDTGDECFESRLPIVLIKHLINKQGSQALNFTLAFLMSLAIFSSFFLLSARVFSRTSIYWRRLT